MMTAPAQASPAPAPAQLTILSILKDLVNNFLIATGAAATALPAPWNYVAGAISGLGFILSSLHVAQTSIFSRVFTVVQSAETAVISQFAPATPTASQLTTTVQ